MYHFGIVNAISRSNTDMEYRVYVDGVGYLFTSQTRIDERIAFLDKYASVALVTKNRKALICSVLSSNTAIPDKDIFFGMVEQVKEADNFHTLTIDGSDYTVESETNTIGTVMIPGTWVFGYEVNGNVRFIAAITDKFPDPSDVESFEGFVSFVGDTGDKGVFYITAGDTTLRVLPDTVIKDPVSPGDYVSGFRINNDILLLDKPALTFDKARFEVYYQPIDDVVSVRDINSPTGQSVVAIIFGEKEILQLRSCVMERQRSLLSVTQLKREKFLWQVSFLRLPEQHRIIHSSLTEYHIQHHLRQLLLQKRDWNPESRFPALQTVTEYSTS